MEGKNNTYKELIDSWRLKRVSFKSEDLNFDSYVSKKDFEAIREEKRNEFFHFYQLHVLPQPFFGNIENPKIVVLAKNPAYDIFNEVVEFDKVKSEYTSQNTSDENLENFIKNKGSDLLFNISYFENNIQKDFCTKKWWKTVFKDLIPESGFDELLKKVGIFNLCGYHSRSYYEFPSKFFKKEEKVFPTQIALRKHLNEIIPKANLVIIIWGEPEWNKFLDKDLLKDKTLVVNKTINSESNEISYDTKRTIVNSKDVKKDIDDDFKNAFIEFLKPLSEREEQNILKNITENYINKGDLK